MGKIGDLWVKLGLKKEEFDRGMNSAKKGVSTFGANFSKVGKLATGAFGMIASAAIAMGTQLIANTNKFGDAWAKVMGGAKNSWRSFMSSIASGDFKGFWKRIGDSYKAGKEEAAARDQIFETQKAAELARAQIQGDLDSLYLDIFNTQLSPQVRQAAIKKYKDLLTPIYEAEKTTTKAVMDATINSWLAAAGRSDISQDKVIDFFKQLGLDPEGAKKNTLYSAYDSLGDGQNGSVFDSITAYLTAVSGLENEMKRLNKQSNLLDNMIGDEEEQQKAVRFTDETLPKIVDGVKSVAEAMDIEMPELISDDYLRTQEERGRRLIKQIEAFKDAGEELDRGLEMGLYNALDEIAQVIGGVEKADVGSVIKALLNPLADAAVTAGMIILTTGEGIQALKKALNFSENPGVAVAAGAALIAVGVAAKAGLAAIGNGSKSSSGSVSSATGSSSLPGVETQELTIYVKGTISGSDIVLAADRQRNKWNR